jgi:hypothetical protein
MTGKNKTLLPPSLKHRRLSYSSQSPKKCRSLHIRRRNSCIAALPTPTVPPTIAAAWPPDAKQKKDKLYLQPPATEPPPRIGSRRRRPLASSPSLAVARPLTQPEPRAPRCRACTRPPINSKHLDVVHSVVRLHILTPGYLVVAPARLVSSACTSPLRPTSIDSLH